VGLGWWGQHIIRQTAGSDIVRVVRAVGSREGHRANVEKFRVDFTTDFAGTLTDPSIDLARAGKHVFC